MFRVPNAVTPCPDRTVAVITPTLSSCGDCPANCAVCNTPSICRTCDSGYDLRNGTCVEREILARWKPLYSRYSSTFTGGLFTAYGAADEGVYVAKSSFLGKRTNSGAKWSVDAKYVMLQCEGGWQGTPLSENYLQWQVGGCLFVCADERGHVRLRFIYIVGREASKLEDSLCVTSYRAIVAGVDGPCQSPAEPRESQ